MKSENIKFASITAICIIPYLFFPPFILVSFLPLVYILYRDNRIRWLTYSGIGICACAIVLSPLVLYDIAVYLFGVSLTSFFVISFCVISKFLITRYGYKKASVFIPPFVWMILYYLLNFRSLSASAFDLGGFVPSSAPLIWYIGSPGLTFLIILMNSLIAYSLIKKDKAIFTGGVIIIAIFAFCSVYSNIKDPKDFAGDRKPIKAALIQGNIHEKWGWLQKNPYSVLERYRALSLEAAKGRPDIIIWPEFALPLDFINYNKEVREAVKEIILSAGANFIIGSIIYDEKTKLHEDAALVFDKKANLVDYYSSVSPAPFNRFTKEGRRPLKAYMDGAGIMVCWEEIDSSISRRYAKFGSKYLVSLANNQDLDKTYLMRFASRHSRARAAENKRYLARCANTGITQLIDPMGKVVKTILPETRGILAGEIYPISEKTFYSKYGDILVRMALVLIFLYLSAGYFISRSSS